MSGVDVEARNRGVGFEDRVLGVDAEGCLTVKDSRGQVRQVRGGEVRVAD